MESINQQAKPSILDQLQKCSKGNSFLYKYQLKNEPNAKVKSETKWESIFTNRIIKWKQVYTMPFITTIDTRLRNFQYKYINRIIPTNKYLMKCKLKLIRYL